MVAVGMVWNPDREGQVRYVCGLTGGLAALGDPLRRQAGQVGMDRAERVVAIEDGGSGLEDWLRVNFPRVDDVILDFYHAAEHLCAWAKALHVDESESKAAGASWCHRKGKKRAELPIHSRCSGYTIPTSIRRLSYFFRDSKAASALSRHV